MGPVLVVSVSPIIWPGLARSSCSVCEWRLVCARRGELSVAARVGE